LDLEDLRAATDGVDEDTSNEGNGDAGVIAADCKVDEIPALRPSTEAGAGCELDNHENVVQNRRYEQMVIPGLDAVTKPDVEE
jgi:hypothetical protein